MSGRVYLFFPSHDHEPPPTLCDRLNPHLSLNAIAFQSPVMPNARMSLCTQSVYSFSFPPRPLRTAHSRFPNMIHTRLTVGKEVCCSFERQEHVARHRDYRLVLSLRSRCRQKTKNRSPPKNYRHILGLPSPPESLPPKNEKPPIAEK